MELKTQRLNIRFIEANDWKSLLEIWDDCSHSSYAQYDVPHATTESDARKQAESWAEVSLDKEHMFFVVCLGDEIIGYVDFHQFTGGYEFGYCFHSKVHGKGYAQESIRALMEELSGERRTRFVAGTARNNVPSVKLLEHLGFERVGEEQVSFYKDKNGEDIYFTGDIFVFETK